jgi:integrase
MNNINTEKSRKKRTPNYTEASMCEIQKLFEDFINECKFSDRLRAATVNGYIKVFETFIRIMPEITEPAYISVSTITTFFQRLQTRERLVGKEFKVTGIRNSTARGYCNRLNAFFKWLEKNNKIEQNPFVKIEMPKATYEDRRSLNRDDIERIIAAIAIHTSSSLILKRDMLIIHILLLCGIRKGELRAIQVQDIDFDKRMLAIRGKTSKSKFTRYIPINPTLLMYLKDYLRERKKRKYTTPYLLVSHNGDRALSEYGLKHWIQKLVQRSKVKFHLHQFRHTFACNLANMNVGAVKIQKLMGHTDIRMTMTYLRSMTAEDLRGEIDNLSIDNFM